MSARIFASAPISGDLSQSPIEKFVLTMPPSTPMKRAIAQMAEHQVDCVLALEQQSLKGILTERDVVQLSQDQECLEHLTLADCMTTSVITLKASEMGDIFALLRILNRNHIRHLPIVNEKAQIEGIVTPHSLRRILQPEHLLRYIRVEEIIQTNVISALPQDSILAISQRMLNHRVSCVVIVQEDTRCPMGIVTERDIVRFHQMELNFADTQAAEVMSCPLSTVHPQDSLWSIHQTMQRLRVRRLVVVHSTGSLAGIITQTQILKVLDPMEMFQVVQQMQATIDQQTEELRRLNQELECRNQELVYLSTVDELTNVANRRRLNSFLEDTWQQLLHQKRPLSIIMCDIDYFKRYNDTYGHLAGDQCLTQVAQTMRAITRKRSDLLARYGGEEFALVLPNTSGSVAERIAQTILEQVRALNIPHQGSEVHDYLTVSLGVVAVIPSDARGSASLLNLADEQLYRSKQKGRNTYSLLGLDSELVLDYQAL